MTRLPNDVKKKLAQMTSSEDQVRTWVYDNWNLSLQVERSMTDGKISDMPAIWCYLYVQTQYLEDRTGSIGDLEHALNNMDYKLDEMIDSIVSLLDRLSSLSLDEYTQDEYDLSENGLVFLVAVIGLAHSTYVRRRVLKLYSESLAKKEIKKERTTMPMMSSQAKEEAKDPAKRYRSILVYAIVSACAMAVLGTVAYGVFSVFLD